MVLLLEDAFRSVSFLQAMYECAAVLMSMLVLYASGSSTMGSRLVKQRFHVRQQHFRCCYQVVHQVLAPLRPLDVHPVDHYIFRSVLCRVSTVAPQSAQMQDEDEVSCSLRRCRWPDTLEAR